MSGLVAVGLTNAASATLLALVAAGVARFVRRPALVHGLWLLVLLELLTPPVLVVGVLPTIDQATTTAQIPAVSSDLAALDLTEQPVIAASANVRQAVTWGQLASGVWILGAAVLLLLAFVRAIRFERLLRRGAIAPAPLRARAESLARALGLRRSPLVRLVPARVSPLLWFRPGRMEIVFPAALVERLEPAELDALLAHELAHVRRGDHWVRWLELAASALFFWHPVVWWARARMRSAEERSCDAWVAIVLPAHARDYAGGVVKALEFLSPLRGPVLPALASGVAQFRSLEERLAMILSHRTPPLPTRTQRIALAAAGIGLLVLFPGAAHRSPDPDQDPDQEEAAAPEAASAEAAAIQTELQELERRQAELTKRLRELHVQADRGVEAKAALLERHAQLDRERVDLERDRHEEMARLEREQVEVQRELERAERSFAVEQRALALESLARKAQLESMAADRERLSEQGRFDEAQRLEQKLAAMKLELALTERGRGAAADGFGLEHEIRALEREAEELASRGEGLAAEKLAQQIEELQRARQQAGRPSLDQDIRKKIARLEAEIERLLELEGVEGGVSGGVEGGVEGGVRGGVEGGVRGGVDDGVREALRELERALEEARKDARERGTFY